MPTTFKANLAAAVDAHTRFADSRVFGGDLKYFRSVYTLTAGTDEAASDLIQFLPIQEGMLIIPETLKLTCEAGALVYGELDLGEISYLDGSSASATKYADGMPLLSGKTQFAYGANGLWTVAEGVHVMGGGAAAEAETVTGVAATDRLSAFLSEDGANADLDLLFAELTANTITYTFNEDPTAAAEVRYKVERPVAQLSGMLTAVPVTKAGFLGATVAVMSAPVAGKKIILEGFYAI